MFVYIKNDCRIVLGHGGKIQYTGIESCLHGKWHMWHTFQGKAQFFLHITARHTNDGHFSMHLIEVDRVSSIWQSDNLKTFGSTHSELGHAIWPSFILIDILAC